MTSIVNWIFKMWLLQHNKKHRKNIKRRPTIYIFWISKRFPFCWIPPRVSVVVGNWRATYGAKLETLGFPWWGVRYVIAVTRQFRQQARYLRHFHLKWVETELCVYNSVPTLYRSDWTDCTIPPIFSWLSFNLPAQPSPAVVREWQFVRLRVFSWLLGWRLNTS